MFLPRILLFLFLVFMQFPVGFGGITLYRILGVLLAFVALFTLSSKGRNFHRSGAISLSVVFLLVIAGILGCMSFGKMEVEPFVKMAQNLVLMVVVAQLVRETKDFKLVLAGIATGGFCSVLTGFPDILAGASTRVGGILGNPNGYGQVCGITCVCAMGLSIASSGYFLRFIWAAMVPIAIVGVTYSGSRGASLALVVALPTFLFIRSARFVGILVAFLAVLLVAYMAPQKFIDRWDTAFVGQKFARVSATEDRVDLIKRGWAVYQSFPVAGVGFGNVRWGMSRVGVESMQVTHNAVIQVMAETGTLGLLAFGFLLVVTLANVRMVSKSKNLDRESRFVMDSFFPLFVMVFVSQLSSGSYVHPMWYLLFGVGADIRQVCIDSERGLYLPPDKASPRRAALAGRVP